jgi:hypothetical protein
MIVSLLLLLVNVSLAQHQSNSPSLGIRILFNRGMLETAEASCSSTEHVRISSALRVATTTSTQRTKLRSNKGAELPRCNSSCEGFDNGTCFQAVDCRPHVADIADTTAHEAARLAAMMSTQCIQAKIAILSVIKQELASDLSRQCKALLQKRMDLDCHVL